MLKIPNVTGEVPRSKNQNLVKYNWMKIDWKLTENWMKIDWKFLFKQDTFCITGLLTRIVLCVFFIYCRVLCGIMSL